MFQTLRFAFVTSFAAAATAQTVYPAEEVRNEHLPRRPDTYTHIVADLDGDGLDDLVTTSSTGQVRLWSNRSNARFADVTAQALPLGAPPSVLALDADGDGDRDLVGVGPTLLRNNGRGVFTLAAAGPGGVPLVAGDFDRDGDADLLVSRSRFLITFRNDGSGNFTEFASTELFRGTPFGALTADVDGDGDLDVVMNGFNLFATYGENDGTGRFTWTVGQVQGNLAFDVDNDGDVDVLQSGMLAFINNGSGLFSEESLQRFPRRDLTSAVVNLDLDGDGDQDLALSGGELWLNNGRGVFSAVPAPELARNFLTGLSAARIDGDRHLDLIATPGHLFLSRGTARFVPLDPAAIGLAMKAVQIGDFTGDGDPDVLERIESGALAYRTRSNDGSGFFLPQAVISVWPSTPLARHEALGDLDRDGDLDVLGSFGGPSRGLVMLPNQGNGVFGAPRPAPYSRNGIPSALYLDDLDGDGDLDALDVSTEGLVIARNDGSGGFPSGSLVWSGSATSADHADFDGDGDRDVLVANDTLTLLENRQGSFVDVTAQYFATPPSGFGRPLVVNAANTNWLLWPRAGVIDVYERVGSSFLARPQLSLTYTGEAVAARRLSTSGGVARVHVRRNIYNPLATILDFDGRSLRDVTAEVLPSAEFDLIGAADLDVDGDLDFVAIDHSLYAMALRSPARALRTRFTPFVGGSVELALRDTSTASAQTVQAVGLVGRIARQPLAGIGLLRIDPRATVVLPVQRIFAPTEVGVSIPVPADLALRDVEFGVQFAHVDAAVRIALGPLARVVVR